MEGKNSLIVTSHLGQQHTGYISISERGQLLANHMEHLKEHFKNLMGTHWEQVRGKTTKNPRVGPLPNMLHSYSPNQKKKNMGLMHACLIGWAQFLIPPFICLWPFAMKAHGTDIHILLCTFTLKSWSPFLAWAG